MNLKQLKEKLQNSNYEEFIKIKEELINDDRKSVVNLLDKYERYYNNLINEKLEYESRLKYEKKLYNMGIKYIAGVDEVGRGPLAGSVYAAAVILNPGIYILGVKDSKKLSPKKREILSDEIKAKALSYSIGFATVDEIDNLNILNATKLAMERAINSLNIKPEYILIDALKLKKICIPQISIIKGDDLSASIGAASIIAKVKRDEYMRNIASLYPEYMFDKNKGYGTKDHINAIKKFGLCPIHRKAFVKNFVEE
jgi:ribonuclease HII